MTLHVAIIMDGNGRWAKSQGRDRSFGHEQGAQVAHQLVEHVVSQTKVTHLTLYVLSQDNLKRPLSEVRFLREQIQKAIEQWGDWLLEKNIKFQALGELESMDSGLATALQSLAERTQDNTGLVLTLAIHYSFDWHLSLGDVYHRPFEIPSIDLLIRTGEEKRLSQFMMAHLQYAELCFDEMMWPDYTPAHFDQHLAWYKNRNRRFGEL